MKVFWSWQSDRIPKNHHYFVRRALEEACESLAQDPDVDESERPEVDHDTTAVAGTPDIVGTVLRKIEAAAAFVADMTPVGVTDPAAVRPDLATRGAPLPEPKLIQNPNVMSELGYAEKCLGTDRIILVANSIHYPGPNALPFDWRHRRGPITYSLADDANNEARKKECSALAKRLREPLRLILAAQRQLADQVEGPLPSETDPAVWAGSENGVMFRESALESNLKRALLSTGPRLYARITPASWRKRGLQELETEMNRREARLWIRGNNGTWGSTADGVLSAQGLSDMPNGYLVRTVTHWFQKSGEIWAVDTTSFGHDEGKLFFATHVPIAPLAKFLSSAVQAILDSGEGPVAIELGCTNLENVFWPGEFRFARQPSLRDMATIRRAKEHWTPSARNQLLLDFWNELRDAYGLPHARTQAEFQAQAGVQLANDG